MTVEASDATDASEASEAQMEPAAIEASDSYSASSDSYGDSYSYSTYSEADSDVEKADKDDKEILQVARHIAPIHVKRQLGLESEESDSQVKTPPSKKSTIKGSATKDIAPSAAKDAQKTTKKPSSATSDDFPKRCDAPKPSEMQIRQRQFVKDELKDKNFQPETNVQQRMALAQKAWRLAETAKDSRVFGCGSAATPGVGALSAIQKKAKKAAERED